jgi:hypothetical protein
VECDWIENTLYRRGRLFFSMHEPRTIMDGEMHQVTPMLRP